MKLKEERTIYPSVYHGPSSPEDNQRRNRFYFYCVLLVLCVAVSFFSGMRLGRTLERERIMERLRGNGR